MPVITIDTLKSWISILEERKAGWYDWDDAIDEVVSEMITIAKAFEEA